MSSTFFYLALELATILEIDRNAKRPTLYDFRLGIANSMPEMVLHERWKLRRR